MHAGIVTRFDRLGRVREIPLLFAGVSADGERFTTSYSAVGRTDTHLPGPDTYQGLRKGGMPERLLIYTEPIRYEACGACQHAGPLRALPFVPTRTAQISVKLKHER